MAVTNRSLLVMVHLEMQVPCSQVSQVERTRLVQVRPLADSRARAALAVLGVPVPQVLPLPTEQASH